MKRRTAAIVTVGSELVQGLRIDTNTAEIARALVARGFDVVEATSVGDDSELLGAVFARLVAACDLVVSTGGLGPTHDDITREAAARALGVELVRDPRLEELLQPWVTRHSDSEAAAGVLVQADVIPGADVIDPTTGTAPGLVVGAGGGTLALLPGPPSEMRPMLEALMARYPVARAATRELGVVGMSESDAQVRVLRALAGVSGIGFTVLARPGDVRVILTDDGAGAEGLTRVADAAASALGDNCYAADGVTLAEAVVRAARAEGATIGLAESCTGGMIAAALTDVAGASDVLLGGVVSYGNDAKRDLLGVEQSVLDDHGAVSRETVRQMAAGAVRVLGVTVAVSVSGIAGPGGGSADKPVGTVWFGLASPRHSLEVARHFPGSREAVRARATAFGLDLLRREILGMRVGDDS